MLLLSSAAIAEYFGGSIGPVHVCYTVQAEPAGFCDAIFRALPLIPPEQQVLFGLPDTIWFPEDGLIHLREDQLSFLLFPVSRPELFDSVVCDAEGSVVRIDVKKSGATSNWIWGAFKMPQRIFADLFQLWRDRHCTDEYLGTLVNA